MPTITAISTCRSPAFCTPAARTHYRFAQPGESEEAFATRLAEELDALIVKEGPDTVAAFIAEPVMGAGGVLVPPHTYFDKIQPVLKKHDVLLIADEVICGFGRLGTMFGPSISTSSPTSMTMAKQLTSGYQPMSATVVSGAIFDALVARARRSASSPTASPIRAIRLPPRSASRR